MQLNVNQKHVLIALMDVIIPLDDYPSASQAGVLGYIEGLISTDLASKSELFLRQLDVFVLQVRREFGSSFCELSSSIQKELFDHILKTKGDSDVFLLSLINLVSEGYYSDPVNGGNLGARSWQMIGFKVEEGLSLTAMSQS